MHKWRQGVTCVIIIEAVSCVVSALRDIVTRIGKKKPRYAEAKSLKEKENIGQKNKILKSDLFVCVYLLCFAATS